MSTETTAEEPFSCPACGRSFAWREQIAGKTAKCKCGSSVKVPAQSPSASASARSAVADIEDDPFAALAAAAAEGEDYAVKEEAGYRCPSCGKGMEPGAVICIYCGFNTKTGKRMKVSTGDDNGAAVAPAAKAGRGAAIPPGGMPKAQPKSEGPSAAAMVKPVLIFVVAAVVVGGAVFGFKMLGGGGGSVASGHPIDQEIARLASVSGEYELKAWNADNSRQQRMVMGMNERQADAYADKLYKMGAKRVLAYGGLMTTVIGVELPSDPEQRKALFAYQAEWHESMMVPVQKDEGQKYILLHMKLVR